MVQLAPLRRAGPSRRASVKSLMPKAAKEKNEIESWQDLNNTNHQMQNFQDQSPSELEDSE